MKVIVVGAGIAGTAAAWAACAAGASVHVIHDRPGASALYSGALDVEPWQLAASFSLDPHVVSFAAAFEAWTVGSSAQRIVTTAGVVRPARGSDTALLDLEPLAGKSIAVLDVAAHSFDARLLALSASAQPWAQQTGTRFLPVKVEGVFSEEELRYGDWDLAHLHDDPARLGALAQKLRAATGEQAAWLVGPWLGTEVGIVEALREQMDVAVGETTSPPGGAAGARFEHARDRLLGELGVTRTRARVAKVIRTEAGLSLTHGTTTETTDAVILATGGIAVGGLRLDAARPEHPGGACFHPSVEAGLKLELDGHDVERVSTLHGVDFTAVGLGVLERVGIATDDGVRARGHERLLVAGDAVAGRPRTALEAVRAGVVAGKLAAS